MKTIIASFLFVLLAVGCTTPYPSVPTDANYGCLPEDYQSLLVKHLHHELGVPENAQFRFATPRTAFVNQGMLNGGQFQWTGYEVDVFVANGQAKEQHETKYVALLRNDVGTNRVLVVESAQAARFVIHYTGE